MRYQPEIDGLRALSVLSVVSFHFGSGWAQGGFIGVDVFFVISGYLITKILIGQAEEGRLSFGDFYVRRIKRLAPALLTLIVICLCLGFFVLFPGDYEGLSISALYTLIAGSNFFFLYHTGYFDATAQSMPLLHTWSLAVEEQFYLIWPLALLFLVKVFGKRRSLILGAISILIFVSFAFNLYAVSEGGLSAFYLTQYRAWELLVGSSLALLREQAFKRVPRIIAELLPALGLMAIGVAVTSLTRDQPYPGLRALLPVIGAAAFLFPIGQRTFLHRAFSTRIPVVLGKSSYSIYLYHWPVLVFWNHFASFEPMRPERGIYLLLLSCALGLLSWRLIEQPFRHSSSPKSRVTAAFFAAQFAIGLACVVVVFQKGFPQRIPEPVRAMASLDLMWNWKCPRDTDMGCEAGRPWAEAAYHIFLVGDSNAAHFLPEFAAAAEGYDVSIRLLGGCSPIVDGVRTRLNILGDYNESCHNSRAKNIAILRSEKGFPILVVFSSAWSSLIPTIEQFGGAPSKRPALEILNEGIENLLAEVVRPGVSVILMSDIPRWEIDPIPCITTQQTVLIRKKCRRSTDRLDWTFFNRNQRGTHELLRRFDGTNNVSVISPEDYLCDSSGCRTTVNGEFIYRDPGHLRRNLKPETLLQLAQLLHVDGIIAAAEHVAAP